jgi:copper(I)-binding protein
VTVRNQGSEPDALLSASSEVATSSGFYETMARDRTMVRQPQKQFDIPAGGTLEMKPGSSHIVLRGLKQALSPGETVHVLLIFQKAGPMSVEALVK